ncbi:hypothetical protein MMC13_004393 [Lambiella insularis]|nr:hypothetical protein [Lambiella insularis]
MEAKHGLRESFRELDSLWRRVAELEEAQHHDTYPGPSPQRTLPTSAPEPPFAIDGEISSYQGLHHHMFPQNTTGIITEPGTDGGQTSHANMPLISNASATNQSYDYLTSNNEQGMTPALPLRPGIRWNGPMLMSSQPQRVAPQAHSNLPSSTYDTHIQNDPSTMSESYANPDDRNIHNNASENAEAATPEHGHYGHSSALDFMRQVQTVLKGTGWNQDPASEGTEDAQTATHDHHSTSHPTSSRSISNKGVHRFGLDHFAVPSRRDADILVESYWMWVDSLYPFLDRATFQKKYEAIWTSAKDQPQVHSPHHRNSSIISDHSDGDLDSDRRLFYCVLNGVFALGCQFEPSIDLRERSASSLIFWQRAKKLLELDLDIFNEGSLQLVQASLLMGLYLQSTELSGACWNLVGIAVRTAQALGLHENVMESSGDEPDSEDAELKERLWGGCVLLDRSLSMTYGRPSMVIPRKSLKHDSKTNSSLEPEEPPTSSGNTPSPAPFFYQALELHEILGCILAEFYDKSTAHASDKSLPSSPQISRASIIKAHIFVQRISTGDFQSLLSFDNALLAWRSKLPDILRPENHETPPTRSGTRDFSTQPFQSTKEFTILKRQAVVLHARYLHTRVLLFRPLLLKQLADSQQKDEAGKGEARLERSVLDKTMFMQASRMCITMAQELESMLTKNIQGGGQTMPEWWSTVYYLYTCATVQLAGRSCPSLCKEVGWDGLKQSWKNCLYGLQAYRSCSLSARRSCKVLELIDKRSWESQPVPRFPNNGTQPMQPMQPTQRTTLSSLDQPGKNVTDSTNPWLAVAPAFANVQSADLMSWDQTTFDPNLGVSFADANANWAQTPIDMAWLSTLPFEMEFNTAPLSLASSSVQREVYPSRGRVICPR